jgi:tubulin beta
VITRRIKGQIRHDLDYVNLVAANQLSTITSSFRFPCILNTDMRKMCTNLMPFPGRHYLVPSLAPLTKDELLQSEEKLELVTRLFDEPLIMGGTLLVISILT